MKPGSVIAVHSTVHPDTCKALAKTAASKRVSVIDAPVSGGGPAAAAGRLMVMVGGEADAVERCRPVFESYADPVVHLGELGSGQTTKLLNNLLFTANLGTAAGAVAISNSPLMRTSAYCSSMQDCKLRTWFTLDRLGSCRRGARHRAAPGIRR